MDDSMRARTFLSTQDGGLGFTAARHPCASALVASWAQNAPPFFSALSHISFGELLQALPAIGARLREAIATRDRSLWSRSPIADGGDIATQRQLTTNLRRHDAATLLQLIDQRALAVLASAGARVLGIGCACPASASSRLPGVNSARHSCYVSGRIALF